MKKKILSIMLGLLCGLPSFATPVSAENESMPTENPKYVMGDASGDGIVGCTDYLKIKDYFLGNSSLKGTAYAMSDINYDGIIDQTDYLKVKSVFLGMSEFDESVWEYEEKLPAVGYKTEGVYCSNRMYGTYSTTVCKGEICGDPECNKEGCVTSYHLAIPLAPGITQIKIEDHEDYPDMSISPNYDLFLYNGEVQGLRYNDETAEKTISVEFENIGLLELEYANTEDSTFYKSHIYFLKSVTDEIISVTAWVNAKTGEVYQKDVYYAEDRYPEVLPSSESEIISMAKYIFQKESSSEFSSHLRGMSVNFEDFIVKEYYDGDLEYKFPVMINGYKTDVYMQFCIYKNSGIVWGYSPQYWSGSWIFNVDKRSIDLDNNFETYKDSITGYEARVHDVQTRELQCEDTYVTITSGGTLGIVFDCLVYNVYTKEYEFHPYSDQTLALAIPSKY